MGREEVSLVSLVTQFGKFSHSGRVTGKLSTCTTDDSCKTGSAYTECMVNGRIARAGLLGQPLAYYQRVGRLSM